MGLDTTRDGFEIYDLVSGDAITISGNVVNMSGGTVVLASGGFIIVGKRDNDSSVGAFGNVLVEQLIPDVAMAFPYYVNTRIGTVSTSGSGTTTYASGLVTLNTTAAINSSAMLRSRYTLRYINGIGGRYIGTAIFTSGAAVGSYQILGIGDTSDGFFFGYNGATFGILRRNAGTDTWVAQSSWNVDPMNGTGPSGRTLNPTLGNVYLISYQWLGFGEIRYFIEDSNTGLFQLVHKIQYSNANTAPSIQNPQLPLMAHVVNTSGNGAVSLNTGSAAGFREGEVDNIMVNTWASEATKSGITTETALMTLRCDATISGFVSRVRMNIVGLNIFNDSTGNNLAQAKIKLNPTLGGTPSYVGVNTDSYASIDTSGTTVTSGTLLWSANLQKNTGKELDLTNQDIRLYPGDIATVSVIGVGTATNPTATLIWKEFQ